MEKSRRSNILLTTKEFLIKLENTRGEDIHKRYDLSQVNYVNCKVKIKVICKICNNDFHPTPDNFLRNRNCPICADRTKADKRKIFKSFNEYINCVKLKFNNKYTYITENIENFIVSKNNIIYICKIHGKIIQNARVHFKSGCSVCGIERKNESIKILSKNRKHTTEWFVNKASSIKIHKDKYDYSKANYISYDDKLEIICKIHGPFWQTPANHLTDENGCPHCGHNTSKKEKKWLDSINVPENCRNKIFYVNGLKFNADGKIDNKIFYFHGCYWHGCPTCYNHNEINPNNKKTYKELYNHTIMREKILKDAGYELIIKWEHDLSI